MNGRSKGYDGRVDLGINSLCDSDFTDVSGRHKTNAFFDCAILAFGLIVLGLMTIFDKFEER
jgi:hypothetical protein